jgi:hypothetical protein
MHLKPPQMVFIDLNTFINLTSLDFADDLVTYLNLLI